MSACSQCQCYQKLGFDITMAFQPIVDVVNKSVYAYEALVRGVDGCGADRVFERVNKKNTYSFDQECRVAAIREIARLDTKANVSINFLPNAIYEPEMCLSRTLSASKKYNFPPENIIFEVTEHEKIDNHSLLIDVFSTYKSHGFRTAIDDFGEGFAGLNLLADFQPDLIKVDMNLIRRIASDRVKQSILSGIQTTASCLGIELIAEGVENRDDYLYLRDNNIRLMQGFYFAKPVIETLPIVYWDGVD